MTVKVTCDFCGKDVEHLYKEVIFIPGMWEDAGEFNGKHFTMSVSKEGTAEEMCESCFEKVLKLWWRDVAHKDLNANLS